ncbi:MAG: 50S ribosomal protein L18 [Alphaproteobacteria bacterium]|nr:50S ribosomal protein L18 [Alphaproteobacteria bacterium]MBN2780223.1 50S ribosomal protein L18 [Alphaproteobacteria bacterium]
MDKNKKSFLKRRFRMRWNLKKINPGKLRLSVLRSSKHFSAQLIDDTKGLTIASVSSMQKAFKDGGNTKGAEALGLALGEKIKAAKLKDFYFDRGGYLYHGRVKAFADGVRKAGVKF